jgi:CelD/BcsL family acetyltransferase involved in cellulose biosynthesis
VSPDFCLAEHESALAPLVPGWLRIAGRYARTPFQTLQWNLSWWQLVGRFEPGLALHVVGFATRGELSCIAPFMVRTEGGQRELCFLSSPFADYHDILVDEDRISPQDAADLVLDYAMARLGGSWDRVELGELSTWPRLTAALAFAKGPVPAVPASPCFRAGAAELAARMDRSQYLYRQRKLERLGEIGFRLHVDGEAIRDRIPEMIALHLRQWVHREDRGITFDRADMIRLFQGGAGRLADAGLVMLPELALNGRPVAYHFGFAYDDTFWAYRPAFDTQLRALSPGHLLNRLLFQELARLGFTTVDLMRGYTPYKDEYCTERSMNMSVSFPAATT